MKHKLELLKEELKKANSELLNNVAFRNYINNSVINLQQGENNALKIVVDKNSIEILEQGIDYSFGEEMKITKITNLQLAPDGLFHISTSLAEYRTLESDDVHADFIYKKESYNEFGILLADVTYRCNNKLDNISSNEIDKEKMLRELKFHEPNIPSLRFGFSQQVPTAGNVSFDASYKIIQRDLNNFGVVDVLCVDLPDTLNGQIYGDKEQIEIEKGIFPIKMENPAFSLNYISNTPISLNGFPADNEEIEQRIKLANQELLNNLKLRPSSDTIQSMIELLTKQLDNGNKIK